MQSRGSWIFPFSKYLPIILSLSGWSFTFRSNLWVIFLQDWSRKWWLWLCLNRHAITRFDRDSLDGRPSFLSSGHSIRDFQRHSNRIYLLIYHYPLYFNILTKISNINHKISRDWDLSSFDTLINLLWVYLQVSPP